MLMSHNISVYQKFEAMLNEFGQCILVTATGTGKSYIVKECLEKYNMRGLVVCPKLCICDNWKSITDHVDTITYHSFCKNYDKYYDEYDCYIFDEAHHMGGNVWGNSIKTFMENTNAPIIGLTATSKRYSDSRDVAEEFFDNCVVFGYDQQEAIEQGILPKADYIYSLFDTGSVLEDIDNKIKNIKNPILVKNLEGRLSKTRSNILSIKDILTKLITTTRKGIVFVDSINAIPSTVDLIKSAFPNEKVLYVHSNLSDSEVSRTIEEFKSLKSGYIVSVDMLNEGLHIDGVNTIIMLRKTQSPIVFIQQIGRGLAGKSKDRILIFDFVGNNQSIKYLYERVNDINKELSKEESRHCKSIKYSDQTIITDYASSILEILSDINRILRNNWTKEEDDLLRKIYSNRDKIVDNIIPGRSASSIRHRAKKLLGSRPRSYIRWTKEEDDLLREIYDNGRKIVDNIIPGRSASSIISRAGKIGLTNNGLWTKEDEDILRKIYSNGDKLVDNMIPGRTVAAIKGKAKKLGIIKKSFWTKEEDDLLRKIYSNRDKIVDNIIPGRSIVSIKSRASRMGISKKRK